MYDELIKRLRRCTSYDPRFVIQDCEDAADAIEDLEKSLAVALLEYQTANNKRLMTEEYAKQKHLWIPVTERLPESETHVLAACRTLFSNCGYICDAFYAAPKSIEVSCYDACECETEYDEEEDKYFLVSGWYEVIKNWDDYNSIAIEDKVTHWMPLPEPPKEEAE